MKTPGNRSIRSLFPVTGNWYCVTQDLCGDEKRWFIDRVAIWALVEKDDEVDHVRGITGSGMPSETAFGDENFVYGPDLSSIGKTWDEIYAEVVPWSNMVREITHLFADDLLVV